MSRSIATPPIQWIPDPDARGGVGDRTVTPWQAETVRMQDAGIRAYYGHLTAPRGHMIDPAAYQQAAEAEAERIGVRAGDVITVEADPARVIGGVHGRRPMRVVGIRAVSRMTSADITPSERVVLALDVEPAR